MFHKWNKNRERAGFTALEVIIAVTIFAGVIVGAFNMFVVSQPFANTSLVKTAIEDQARATLDKIVNEVRRAHQPSIVPAEGTEDETSLEFTLITGFADNIDDPQFGSDILYELQDHPDDPIGGGDDNGNGLIDEQILVRTETPLNGGDPIVSIISNFVERKQNADDPEGFSVSHSADDRITLRLTIVRRDPAERRDASDPDAIIHRASLETDVLINNVNEVGN